MGIGDAECLRLLRSPVPLWFRGTMGSISRARWCGICRATARPAAFAAALGASVNPIPLPWSRTGAPPSLGSRHGSPPRFLQARIGRKSNRGSHGVHSDGLRSLSLSSTASLREGCAYAEAFGYAAHKEVGTLFEAGNAVAGEALQQPYHAFFASHSVVAGEEDGWAVLAIPWAPLARIGHGGLCSPQSGL